ncbi:TetR/AcrR family transcriptional regulator [Chitinimonas sp.]|uniref:TetR/AcrR family transcriptional regulator n=1 Tax=Chitinimonas sp. TaxID=1934313 RepID=UPI002F9442E7
MRTKSEARRQAIIETATQLFHEVGFENASMAEISARVGGSKATLYNYFSSKDELFVATVLAVAEGGLMEAFTLLQPTLPLREVLQKFGCHYLKVMLSPAMMATRRMVIATSARSSVGRLLYEHGPKRGWGMVAAFLQSTMERGELRQTESFLCAWHLRALLESELVEVMMLGVLEETSPAQIAAVTERAVDAFLRAYRPD